MPSILNATTTSGLVTSADNSGSLQLQTNNGTTAVTIDTSQNVGIGTATPLAPSSGRKVATINGTTDAMYNIGIGGTYTAYFYSSASNTQLGSATNIPLQFYTNDTERMRIDSSGRVTTPSQPVFRASLSSDVLISTTSATKIPYNTVDFNVGSNFNTTTSRFTAPIAGKYLVCVTYNTYNVAGGSFSKSSIYLNGGLHQNLSMNYSDVTGDHVYTGSMIMNLGANDYVEVFTESNDSSYGLSGSFLWNTFSGYLLG